MKKHRAHLDASRWRNRTSPNLAARKNNNNDEEERPRVRFALTMPQVAFYLVVFPLERPSSVVICRSYEEVRNEWSEALSRDPNTGGLLHCGEYSPEMDDVRPFLNHGQFAITEAARLVLPDTGSSARFKLGVWNPRRGPTMKVYGLKRGWRRQDMLPRTSREDAHVRHTADAPGPHDAPATFVTGLLGLLQDRTPRQATALRARFAVDGQRATLEEAGRLVNVTRERVRQLESAFLRAALGQPWVHDTVRHLQELVRKSTSIVYISELADRDARFSDVQVHSEFIRAVLPLVSAGTLQLYELPNGSLAICDGAAPPWFELERRCLEGVAALRPNASTIGDVEEVIRRTLEEVQSGQFASVMAGALREHLHFSVDGKFLACGDTNKTMAVALLRESDRPLHYAEVAERWSAKQGEVIDAATALRSLIKAPAALLFGRGTYGVREHLRMPAVLVSSIVADCEYIVTNAVQKRQWHTSEVLAILQQLRPDVPEDLDKYVLDILLRDSTLLTPVGRLVWQLKHAEIADRRIDMRTAAIEVLEAAGGPLTDLQLRAEILRRRGLDRSYFFLQPIGDLARVAPGVWGLISRDFGVRAEDIASIQSRLHKVLTIRAAALHSSEILDAMAGEPVFARTTGYMIQQLGARDDRMKLFYGEFIGLSAWGDDPRRMTIRAAVEYLVDTFADPLSLDDIHREVEKLTGRKLLRQSVYSAIAQTNLAYDPATSTWCKAADDSEMSVAD